LSKYDERVNENRTAIQTLLDPICLRKISNIDALKFATKVIGIFVSVIWCVCVSVCLSVWENVQQQQHTLLIWLP